MKFVLLINLQANSKKNNWRRSTIYSTLQQNAHRPQFLPKRFYTNFIRLQSYEIFFWTPRFALQKSNKMLKNAIFRRSKRFLLKNHANFLITSPSRFQYHLRQFWAFFTTTQQVNPLYYILYNGRNDQSDCRHNRLLWEQLFSYFLQVITGSNKP